MKEKRYSAPRAKTGELKAKWGKLEHDAPDLCYVWGEGVSKCDARLLHSAFTCRVMRYGCFESDKPDHNGLVFDPSFFDELKSRGYDMTTFRFSIQKLPTTQS